MNFGNIFERQRKQNNKQTKKQQQQINTNLGKAAAWPNVPGHVASQNLFILCKKY